MYANERSVGDAISTFLSSNAREDIYVTTKFDHLSPNAGQPTVKDVLKGQLKALKVDYVDLYLLHTPTPFVGRLGEVWKEFEGVKAEGLAKDIGISNFRVGDLNELFESIDSRRGVVPAVHQVSLPPSSIFVSFELLWLIDVCRLSFIHTSSRPRYRSWIYMPVTGSISRLMVAKHPCHVNVTDLLRLFFKKLPNA